MKYLLHNSLIAIGDNNEDSLDLSRGPPWTQVGDKNENTEKN